MNGSFNEPPMVLGTWSMHKVPTRRCRLQGVLLLVMNISIALLPLLELGSSCIMAFALTKRLKKRATLSIRKALGRYASRLE